MSGSCARRSRSELPKRSSPSSAGYAETAGRTSRCGTSASSRRRGMGSRCPAREPSSSCRLEASPRAPAHARDDAPRGRLDPRADCRASDARPHRGARPCRRARALRALRRAGGYALLAARLRSRAASPGTPLRVLSGPRESLLSDDKGRGRAGRAPAGTGRSRARDAWYPSRPGARTGGARTQRALLRDYEDANRNLEKHFGADFNLWFTVQPQATGSVFVPWVGVDLTMLLSIRHDRVVQRDTVRFGELQLQLQSRRTASLHALPCHRARAPRRHARRQPPGTAARTLRLGTDDGRDVTCRCARAAVARACPPSSPPRRRASTRPIPVPSSA